VLDWTGLLYRRRSTVLVQALSCTVPCWQPWQQCCCALPNRCHTADAPIPIPHIMPCPCASNRLPNGRYTRQHTRICAWLIPVIHNTARGQVAKAKCQERDVHEPRCIGHLTLRNNAATTLQTTNHIADCTTADQGCVLGAKSPTNTTNNTTTFCVLLPPGKRL